MITRNNYEEYFLLYTDNELTDAEKKAVEDFIAANPDLKEELSLLKQSVFKPEQHIVFENKELLMKKEERDAFINHSNYEEYFLLYTDNELNETQKKEVESFASANPALKQELDILLQTCLQPDAAIVFKNKEILFRKEKDERVIPVFWISVAATVAVILVLFFMLNNKAIVKNEIAGKGNQQQKNNLSENSTSVAKAEIKNNDTVTSPVSSSLEKKQSEIKQTQRKEEMQNTSTAKKGNKKEQEQKTIVPSQDLPGYNDVAQPKSIRPVEIARTTVTVSPADPAVPNTALSSTAANIIDKPADITSSGKEEINYAKQALQKENAAATDETFYFANVSSKKNSLRGLFRKVSRVLNKNASADDDDKHGILIGSFQTALK